MNIRKTFATVAVAGAIALAGLACGGTDPKFEWLEDRMVKASGISENRKEITLAGCRLHRLASGFDLKPDKYSDASHEEIAAACDEYLELYGN